MLSSISTVCREIASAVGTEMSFSSLFRYLQARSLVSRYAGSVRERPAIALRLNGGTRVGLRLGTTDILVFREIFVDGEYSRPLASLPNLADRRRRFRILDLGANIGLTAVLFHRIYPNAEMVSVEPDSANFAMLRSNVAEFADRVQTVHAFVSDAPGWGEIRDNGSGAWGFQLSPVRAGGPAATRVLDIPSLLDAQGWERADLLKCDIEGSEAEVFRHGASWLSRVNAIVVELHGAYTVADLVSALRPSQWQLTFVEEKRNTAVCALSRRQ